MLVAVQGYVRIHDPKQGGANSMTEGDFEAMKDRLRAMNDPSVKV